MPVLKIFPRLLVVFLIYFCLVAAPAKAQIQVNLPNLAGLNQMNQAAVFWFGQVTNNTNYADVRAGYTDTNLLINLNIMDRYLWYDPAHNLSNLTAYDALSLYLSTATSPGTVITPQEYLFQGELNWWENDLDFQAGFQGTTGHLFSPLSFPLITDSGWRGNAPNDATDDRGWSMAYTIPFSLLGASSPPSPGTIWHLGLILHDRDNLTQGPEPVEVWPPGFNAQNPNTWGTIHFGLPPVTPAPSQNPTTFIVRQDASHQVIDAQVGGSSVCGGASAPDYFPTWGSTNYSGDTTLVEQNQGDIADWPCFSKILLKFPLSSLPPGKVITKATLTMHQFGNSDPSQATASYIQVMTTSGNWTEAAVTWNNAPESDENVAISQVEPVSGNIVWPGWQRDWDLTYGVSKAYGNHQTDLSLALYSSDLDYNSGKYFTSSDAGDWDLAGRPTLTLILADPIAATGPGDYNGDGKVDFADLSLFLPHFDTSDNLFNLISPALVNIFDYNQFLKYFGK